MNSTKTDEEYIQHSEALDREEIQYGQGPTVAYGIDLAFVCTSQSDWQRGTDYFESQLSERGWRRTSAGTLLSGVDNVTRDMQFQGDQPLTKEELDLLSTGIQSLGMYLEYLNQFGLNEWGEQIDD